MEALYATYFPNETYKSIKQRSYTLIQHTDVKLATFGMIFYMKYTSVKTRIHVISTFSKLE